MKEIIKVRAECPQCAAGHIGHMTVDELLERVFYDGCNLSCPLCGLVHLNKEEISHLKKMKIVNSERYKQIQLQAEADTSHEKLKSKR